MSGALTEREREIEALWDEVQSIGDIADRLNLSPRYVRLVADRIGLTVDASEFRRAREAIVASSAALLRALQRAGFA